MTSSKTLHQPYLLQGIMNFFMDQGKVALVAFENEATQEEFERTLQNQASTYLGCEIIQLHAGENEQVLKTFNSLLTRISLQQATHATDVTHANYLLWVSENEHFTPEFFQLLKKIILQFSGLQLKLYISVTSDLWSEQLFDIAGRKIAYWFVPASPPAANLAAPNIAAALPATSATTEQSADVPPAQTAATMAPTADTLPPKPSGLNRNLNLWVSVLFVMVLLAATAYGLRDSAESFGPTKPTSANTPSKDSATSAHTDAKSEAAAPGTAESDTAPIAMTQAPVSDVQRPSPPTEVAASANDKSAAPAAANTTVTEPWPASVRSSALLATPTPTPPTAPPTTAATAAAVSAPALAAPDTTQALGINTQADCPTGAENLPTAKPASYIKDTNYIYIKSPQSRKICVAAAGSAYRLVNLSANKGTTIYGNSPWRVYSPDLRRVELYFQGARVPLASNVTDQVQVLPR